MSEAPTDDEWPCDDYAAPLTCFTTPRPRTDTCEGCRAAFPEGGGTRALYAVTAWAQDAAAHAANVFAGDRECGDWTCWCPGRPHAARAAGGPDEGTAERALDEVETVLIENRRGTTNQMWLWDKVYDIVREVRAAADTGHQGGE